MIQGPFHVDGTAKRSALGLSCRHVAPVIFSVMPCLGMSNKATTGTGIEFPDDGGGDDGEMTPENEGDGGDSLNVLQDVL